MTIVVTNGVGTSRTFVEAIVEQALIDVPGCERNVAEMQTFNALQEFCRLGRAVTVEHVGPYTLKANDPRVFLDPVSEDFRIGYVWEAYLEGRRLQHAQYRQARSLDVQATISGSEGTPYWYTTPEPGLLKIYPLSSVDRPDTVTVTAALVPITLNASLPDKFFTHYLESVKGGCLERLMRSPKKPYSSAAGAMVNSRIFRNGWKAARDSTARGYSLNAPGAWMHPQGWANSGRFR